MGTQKKFVAKNGIQTFQSVLIGTQEDNEEYILQVEDGIDTDDLNIRGSILVNGVVGPAGQVLTSDGSNTFWASATVLNIDGGVPSTVFGGIDSIDGGGV